MSVRSTVPLMDLAARYLEYSQHVRELAPNTLVAIRSDLRGLDRWLREQGAPPSLEGFTAANLSNYLLDLRQNAGAASQTIHRKKQSFRGFGRWAVAQGLLTSNPADQVELGRKLARPRVVLYEHKAIQRLLGAPLDGLPLPPPSAATLRSLLIFTGMRRSEVMGLKWGAVDLPGRRLHVFGSKNTRLKAGDPDGLDRAIPLCQNVCAALADMKPGEPGAAIIRNRQGQPASKDQISETVRLLGAAADLPAPVTTHCFRHNLASHLLMLGATEADVALLLGHSPKSTTMGYIHTPRTGWQGCLRATSRKCLPPPEPPLWSALRRHRHSRPAALGQRATVYWKPATAGRP